MIPVAFIDYDFLDAKKIEGSVPWMMLRDEDFGHQSIQNRKVIAAGSGFRPKRADAEGHVSLVAERSRSAAQCSAMGDFSGDGGEGAGGLESPRVTQAP